MVHSRAWNFPETIPADSDKVGLGDDEIRNLSDDISERAIEGGQDWGNSTTTDGRHFAHATGSTPGFKVFKSDKTTTLLNFSDTAVTLDAGATYAGGNITTGTDPGHVHTGAIVIQVPDTVSTGRVVAVFRAPRALTILKMSLVVGTAPQGNNLRVDAFKISSPAATTDRKTAGTSIFALDADKPVVLNVTPDEYSGSTTTFATTALAANDELVFNIDNTGAWTTAPENLSIQLDVK